ncbi:MAG: ATP-binding protein, partial [Cyclobacteriaceae bacterium]|nr:ATP-binding protein [Cyclobacteriaceae bacterium SS2]
DGSTVVTIEDNGPGIDEDALEKIFIPFFTTKKGGSGIGLTLSKQIMRLHNGTITVKSKVNEGTTFTLKFIDQSI